VTCQKSSEASRYGWLFVLFFWLVLPLWCDCSEICGLTCSSPNNPAYN
jgi:hypothetical protein